MCMSQNATGASALVEETSVYVPATCLQQPIPAIGCVRTLLAFQNDLLAIEENNTPIECEMRIVQQDETELGGVDGEGELFLDDID